MYDGAAVAAVAREREMWLAAVTELLARHPFVAGVWLVGSLGRGLADDFSDVDLVVAVDAATPSAVLGDPVTVLPVPGTVLYTRPKPRNAPAGGAYQAICVELAGLPVLVDLYLWPATTAAVPVDSRVLYARTELPRSELGFMALLDRHRSTDTTGADPDDPASVLLLVQLAAKYRARGDDDRRHGIHHQLQIPPDAGPAALRDVLGQRIDLARRPAFRAAVAAAHRLLDLIDPSYEGTVHR
jgi:predicted nucleotidyltransferase